MRKEKMSPQLVIYQFQCSPLVVYLAGWQFSCQHAWLGQPNP
jgi:hypothetical protein